MRTVTVRALGGWDKGEAQQGSRSLVPALAANIVNGTQIPMCWAPLHLCSSRDDFGVGFDSGRHVKMQLISKRQTAILHLHVAPGKFMPNPRLALLCSMYLNLRCGVSRRSTELWPPKLPVREEGVRSRNSCAPSCAMRSTLSLL